MPSAKPGAEQEVCRRVFDYVRKRDYVNALQECDRASEQEPRNFTHWINRGAVLHNFVENNCIPWIGQSFHTLVVLFDRSGNIQESAKRRYRSFLDPVHLGGLERCLEEAERSFNEAIQLEPNPSCSLAFFWRGVLYRNTGVFERALNDLEKFVEANEGEQAETAKEYILAIRHFDWTATNLTAAHETTAYQGDLHVAMGEELYKILREIGKRVSL
ncbi:MAG: hypothetical protein GY719_00150 [bacterium]|nr:hypothetical protein [bacterium]